MKDIVEIQTNFTSIHTDTLSRFILPAFANQILTSQIRKSWTVFNSCETFVTKTAEYRRMYELGLPFTKGLNIFLMQ